LERRCEFLGNVPALRRPGSPGRRRKIEKPEKKWLVIPILSEPVYPYNDGIVAFYIGAGLGGASTSDLERFDAATNSYTAGLGFELHLASHLSLDAKRLCWWCPALVRSRMSWWGSCPCLRQATVSGLR